MKTDKKRTKKTKQQVSRENRQKSLGSSLASTPSTIVNYFKPKSFFVTRASSCLLSQNNEY